MFSGSAEMADTPQLTIVLASMFSAMLPLSSRRVAATGQRQGCATIAGARYVGGAGDGRGHGTAPAGGAGALARDWQPAWQGQALTLEGGDGVGDRGILLAAARRSSTHEQAAGLRSWRCKQAQQTSAAAAACAAAPCVPKMAATSTYVRRKKAPSSMRGVQEPPVACALPAYAQHGREGNT